ncbi:hypothetical protein LSAT2_021714 [Lamellibrachia satsuma]|nr:hypothetical protein LSAT2_021714 [Lamellibrachia satsuma]
MGILPTGYGETLIYTILPRVLDMLPGNIGWHTYVVVDAHMALPFIYCWSSEERLHTAGLGLGAVHPKLSGSSIDTVSDSEDGADMRAEEASSQGSSSAEKAIAAVTVASPDNRCSSRPSKYNFIDTLDGGNDTDGGNVKEIKTSDTKPYGHRMFLARCSSVTSTCDGSCCDASFADSILAMTSTTRRQCGGRPKEVQTAFRPTLDGVPCGGTELVNGYQIAFEVLHVWGMASTTECLFISQLLPG